MTQKTTVGTAYRGQVIGNALKAVRSHGAGDDAFLEMGDSTDEAPRDGEASVGIFSLSAEGKLAETVGGSGC